MLGYINARMVWVCQRSPPPQTSTKYDSLSLLRYRVGILNRDESIVQNPMFGKTKKRQIQLLTKLSFVSRVLVYTKNH